VVLVLTCFNTVCLPIVAKVFLSFSRQFNRVMSARQAFSSRRSFILLAISNFLFMVNKYFALFFMRTLLGLILLMQGWGKVWQWGVDNVYTQVFESSFQNTWLPQWLLWCTAWFTSYAELIAGGLLVLGLFKRWALYTTGVVLLVVSYGHGLQSPVWDLQHVFFRAALLVALLLLPPQWDQWHLDRFIKIRIR